MQVVLKIGGTLAVLLPAAVLIGVLIPVSPSTLTYLKSSLKSSISNLKSAISDSEEQGEERAEEGRAEEGREKYDQPGEAAEFYRAKRLPEGERELPVEQYFRAIEQMREMPQYSTARGALLPSRLEMTKTNAPSLLDAWKPLGPGNLGGRTRALVISPANPDVMYAGAAAGGVWKTMDGGRTWKPMADLLANIAVNALAIDPRNPDVIYAGTGEGYFNSDSIRGAGIFKSFDGGATWRRLETTGTADFHYVNDIVVSPAKSNQVYAATRNGVLRSLDGGASWSPPMSGIDRVNGGCLDLAIRTDQQSGKDFLFASCGTAIASLNNAGVQAAIYRHTNAAAGLTAWELVHSEPGMGRASLAIAPSNQEVVYAVSAESGAAGTPHALHAVFRSASGGAPDTWFARARGNDPKKLNAVLFSNPIYAFFAECQRGNSQFYNQGWYNNTIAVDPKDENSVWVGGVDLFRSDDGGANWGMASFWHLQPSNPRFVHADQHAIVFHPRYDGASNRTAFVANDGGIYKTEDARAQTSVGERAPCSPENNHFTWVSLNNGYEVTQFYHGAPFPDGARYLGGTQDNGVVTGADDRGVNGWREILPGDGGYVAVGSNGAIYAETTWLSLRRSTDNGATWQSATTGISNAGFNFITPFVVQQNDPNRLWIGGRQMWRTTNGARNWSQASADLQASATAIAVAPADDNFVLAGTKDGQIHRTTTGQNSEAGASWPFAKPRDGYVSWLAFDPSNRDIAYATYSTFGGKHIWRSLDAGASWQPIDGALPDIPAHCIVVDPANPQRLFLGTDLGVFVSIDGGASWAVENNGFANVPIESMSLLAANGATYLFAFTHGRGAWRVQLSGACVYAVSPAALTVGVEGGRFGVNVHASRSDCAWSVESSANWITVAGESNSQGSGAVTLEIAPNNDSKTRTATVTIAGKPVSVMQAGPAVSVSAASLRGNALAPESIVSAFGAGLAPSIQLPPENQLPLSLANTVVTVKDSAGVERKSPLFFVSPNQVNYQMPVGTADGAASVTITSGATGLFSGTIQIARVAPGLFTANASGQGVAVGNALRVRGDGTQTYEPISRWDAAQARYVTSPIDLDPASDQLFLILYGTGLRYRSSLPAVMAKIGGIDAQALYTGAQGAFAGLDQINLPIPRLLAGRGEIEILVTVDGQQANLVRVSIK